MKNLLTILFLSVCLPSFAQRFMEEVPNIAALKARPPGSINKSIFVRGYASENDGGGGSFIITNSIIGVDNGLKIQSTAGATFAYLRQFSGPVDPRWFGATGDGATDDTVRLQEAITQSTSKGYALRIPKKRFKTTAPLNIPSNAQIEGEGAPSVIYGTFSGIVMNVAGVTNVTLSDFAIGGAYIVGVYVPSSAYIRLRNLDVSGATVAGVSFTAGIDIEGSRYVTIDKPYLHNNGVNSTNLAHDYNILANFSGVPSYGLRILHPTVVNENSKFGIVAYASHDLYVEDVYIDMNNKGTPHGFTGYALATYGTLPFACQRVTFNGGTITNAYDNGIYMNNTIDGLIQGFHIDHVAQVADDTTLAKGGITVTSSAGVRVFGNSVTNTGPNSGITLANTTNCVVIGNDVYLTGTNHWGIALRGPNQGYSIKGNTIIDTHRAIGDVLGNGISDSGDIEGNVIRNAFDGILLSTQSSNTVIRANRIYNTSDYSILDQALNTTLSDNIMVKGNVGLALLGTAGIVKGNFVSGHTVGSQVVGTGYKFDPYNRLENDTTAIIDTAGALVKTLTSGQYPSVKDTLTYYLQYASPTTITNFADALPGAIRRFVALNTNATLAYSASIILDGAGNLQMKTGDSIILTLDAGGGWHQTGRSLNSNWLWYDRTNERSWFGSPAIAFVPPSITIYPWEIVVSSNLANALLFRAGILGAQNAIAIQVDGTTNYIHYLNGVGYKFPYTQGPAGGLMANDGSGGISWQLPANIFNFGPQFTVTGNTNIALSVGLTTYDQVLAGNVSTPIIDLGSKSGAFTIDAGLGLEYNLLLSGDASVTITNFSNGHNINVTLTNAGNFSLTFADSVPNGWYWRANGTSTQQTNDWGAGVVNTFTLWTSGGRVLARKDGLDTLVSGAVGANPTALVGLTPVNGASGFFTRSDAAPALDQSISPTWTAPHIFQGSLNNVLKPITLSNTSIAPNSNTALSIPFDLLDDSSVSYEAGSVKVGRFQDWAGAGTANSYMTLSVMNAGTPIAILTLNGNSGSSFTYPTAIGGADPFAAGKIFQFRGLDSATAGAQKYSPSITWQGSGWNPTSASAVNVQVGAYVIPVQESANNPSARFILEAITTNAPGGAAIFEVTSKSSTILGERINLQTNATDGFVYMPGGSGPPLGTPVTITGKTPFYYDFANNVAYYYNAGAWVPFAQTSSGANWAANGLTNSDLVGIATANQFIGTNGFKAGVGLYNNNTAAPVNAGGTASFLNNSSSRLSNALLSGGNGAETYVNFKAGNRISGGWTTNSALQNLFGVILNRFATATNYTLTVTNHYVAATATCTNTLPPAGFPCVAGQVMIVKNIAGTTTVRPAGADTIDGVAADDTLTAKAAHRYVSDGVSNWEIY